MGLIRAAVGAAGGTMADQWKEFFYCEAMDMETLVVRGRKQTTRRSSNTKGNENIISNGSGIAVADGQCMLIVEQGKIVEVCAEPGEFTYDSSTEPSIFSGKLGDGLKQAFETFGKRFAYGGDTGKDQRIYYVNTKEIMDNKFGTANPLLFHVSDRNTGMSREVQVRCNGVYSYRITNPILFYKNVCGNVEDRYEKEEIDSQLKTEFISALQPAFAVLSKLDLLPSDIPMHAGELEEAMNDALTKKWAEKRGISVVSVAMNPITLKEEDLKKIQEIQDAAVLRDPSMMAATLGSAQAEAMKAAASNPNGAMMGFMGMNMAGNANAMNIQELLQMGNQRQAMQQQQAMQQPSMRPKAEAENTKAEWTCSCGTQNSGKFCMECGQAKPEDSWTCSCGAVNKGKFCPECGKKKPENFRFRCDKCGWEPENLEKLPRFCPECGDPFDDADKIGV